MARQRRNQIVEKEYKRWTAEEDARLLRQVEAFPQNLHKCFIIVSEEIGRTPQGVQAHWYSVLSKKPQALCFFTASKHHVSKNRKNGMGVSTNGSVWRRFMAILRSIV